MTIKARYTALILVVILTNLAVILLPTILEDQRLTKAIHIIYLAALMLALFGRILYLRKNHKSINIKEILILVVITTLSVVIGGIIFRALQG